MYGNLLVWHASEETASTWASAITSLDNKVNRFDAVNIRFGWKPGFRVGIGYESDNCWDVQANFTYFATAKSTGISYDDDILLPEFFNGFLSGNFFFSASLNWKLLMNMFDLEVGRRFIITPHLIIRPSIGLKGGLINQKIHSLWDAQIYTATEDVRNNFHGVGPSFRIIGEWDVYKRLTLIGNFSTALIWGNWHINDIYQRPEALSGLVTPTIIASNIKNSMLGVPAFTCFLGLKWTREAMICTTIQIGYEMQWWVNQLRLPTFQQLPVHGDLTLQGGVFGICLDF